MGKQNCQAYTRIFFLTFIFSLLGWFQYGSLKDGLVVGFLTFITQLISNGSSGLPFIGPVIYWFVVEGIVIPNILNQFEIDPSWITSSILWIGFILSIFGNFLTLKFILRDRHHLFAYFDDIDEDQHRKIIDAEQKGDLQTLLNTLKGKKNIRNIDEPDESRLINYVSKKMGASHLAARNCNDIGHIYSVMGNYDEALAWYQKALSLFEQLNELNEIGIIHNNIGHIYQAQYKFELSRLSLEKSLAILQKTNNLQGMSAVCNNMGRLRRAMGDYDDALDLFLEALRLKEIDGEQASIAISCNYIGETYYFKDALEEGQLAQSRDWYMRGLDVLKKVKRPDIELKLHVNLGNLYAFNQRNHELVRFGKNAYAVKYVNGQTITVQRRTIVPHINLRHATLAYQYYQRGIDLIEQVRTYIGTEENRISYLTDKEDVYVSMVLVCLSLERFAEAFTYMERSKSRTLVDMLASDRPHLNRKKRDLLYSAFRDNFDDTLFVRKNELESHIASLNRQCEFPRYSKIQQDVAIELEKCMSELAKINLEIKSSAFESITLKVVPSIDFEVLHKQIKEGAADTGERPLLVNYFIAKDEIIIFLLPAYNGPPTLTTFRVRWPQTERRTWIENFFYKFERRSQATQKDLSALYKILINPWFEAIQSWSNQPTLLHFSAHGELHALPLHAAYDDSRQRFLIEDYPIAYTPATSLLHFWQTHEKRNGVNGTSAMIFGNPTKDLPGAEKEAKAVAEFWQTKPYLQESAQRDYLLEIDSSRNIGVLHLACHGIFRSDQPILSHLLFADNISLDLNDIMSLELDQVKLVVLSACKSAISERRAGDELIGLTRSFLYAGTPSVIASLWNVNDQSTSKVMVSFYNYWNSGTESKARALQKAQIDYINRSKQMPEEEAYRHFHPYYWAPFILVGDWL
ncbi:MAG: CHAT domain-containing protein [Anaerolineaceae bacterium]|nr:CHAT domain-containing protein [Anaerolineaceae bacterium]